MLRFVPRSDRVFTGEQQAKLRPYKGVVAALLFARGVETAEEADRFLNPSLDQLHDPLLLSGMREAVGLIDAAKTEGLKTVVYGDYDTDGVCAAALLTEALRAYGVDASPYLPLRDDGYGLNAAAVEELSKSCRLLITVDLGITNAEEVALAKSLGMKVIVTDHHQPGLVPCPADAVINPLLNDYPFPYLCGAGVAYKLVTALHGVDSPVAGRALPLAAVATVADIVSMTGENRVIAALGMPGIGNRPGLRALMDVAGIKQPLDEGAVGYQLAPRLNAAGRIGDANAAVRLLMTGDPKDAETLAGQLDAANTERKKLEQTFVNEASLQAQEHDFVSKRVLFVRGAGWHKGVLGLVAGRLNRKYAVPVCALSEEDGLLHGSLRGVPGVNLAECLKTCDDLLIRYGGHEMAAGVTLSEAQYTAFCERLDQAVAASAEADAFVPAQPYDLQLNLEDADLALVDAIAKLRPFGVDAPAPVFFTGGAALESRRACGAGGAHLQLRFRQNKAVLAGIAFGMGGEAAALPDAVDVAYTLEKNEFRGTPEVQCHVAAVRPDEYARRKRLAAEDDAQYLHTLAFRLVEQAGKPGADGEFTFSVPLRARTSDSAESADPVAADDLLQGRQGTLYVAYARETALSLLSRQEGRLDVAEEAVDDPRCFHTLLLRPSLTAKLSPHWRHVVLLDGALSPADKAWWQARCGNARLITPAPSAALAREFAALDAGDEAYRELYRLLRRSTFGSLQETALAAGLSQAQTLAGLWAFCELTFLELSLSPFSYVLLPAAKRSLDESPLLRRIRSLGQLPKDC